jgi:hypothetical protein
MSLQSFVQIRAPVFEKNCILWGAQWFWKCIKHTYNSLSTSLGANDIYIAIDGGQKTWKYTIFIRCMIVDFYVKGADYYNVHIHVLFRRIKLGYITVCETCAPTLFYSSLILITHFGAVGVVYGDHMLTGSNSQ